MAGGVLALGMGAAVAVAPTLIRTRWLSVAPSWLLVEMLDDPGAWADAIILNRRRGLSYSPLWDELALREARTPCPLGSRLIDRIKADWRAKGNLWDEKSVSAATTRVFVAPMAMPALLDEEEIAFRTEGAAYAVSLNSVADAALEWARQPLPRWASRRRELMHIAGHAVFIGTEHQCDRLTKLLPALRSSAEREFPADDLVVLGCRDAMAALRDGGGLRAQRLQRAIHTYVRPAAWRINGGNLSLTVHGDRLVVEGDGGRAVVDDVEVFLRALANPGTDHVVGEVSMWDMRAVYAAAAKSTGFGGSLLREQAQALVARGYWSGMYGRDHLVQWVGPWIVAAGTGDERAAAAEVVARLRADPALLGSRIFDSPEMDQGVPSAR